MQTRRLGRSDLHIAPLVLGTTVFGWTTDKANSFAVLDAFIDRGFNCIDTADVYTKWAPCGPGTSETIIGEWMKARGVRDRIVLGTKLGSAMAPDKKGLSAAYIKESIEGSLRRLQTDYVDLYQPHIDDLETPQEETMRALADLVVQGKVRVLGVSKLSPDRVRSALRISEDLGLPRFETLQTLYNLYDREEFEGGYRPICVEQQISGMPFYGLASGFLTGKYRPGMDLSQQGTRGGFVKDYMNARGFRILTAMDAVAAQTGATLAQIALAWEIVQPGIAGPLASATSAAQMEDIAGCVDLKLSAEQLGALDAASAVVEPA